MMMMMMMMMMMISLMPFDFRTTSMSTLSMMTMTLSPSTCCVTSVRKTNEPSRTSRAQLVRLTSARAAVVSITACAKMVM
jgi:hypothetical protein